MLLERKPHTPGSNPPPRSAQSGPDSSPSLSVIGRDLRGASLARESPIEPRRTFPAPAVQAAPAPRLSERARVRHQRDLADEAGWVDLPPRAPAKRLPSAGCEWPSQCDFPATRHYVDREMGQKRRHHLHETVVQDDVRHAVLGSGIPKRATCQNLRHSFARHIAEDVGEIRTVQELLGHQDVVTTMIYTPTP